MAQSGFDVLVCFICQFFIPPKHHIPKSKCQTNSFQIPKTKSNLLDSPALQIQIQATSPSPFTTPLPHPPPPDTFQTSHNASSASGLAACAMAFYGTIFYQVQLEKGCVGFQNQHNKSGVVWLSKFSILEIAKRIQIESKLIQKTNQGGPLDLEHKSYEKEKASFCMVQFRVASCRFVQLEAKGTILGHAFCVGVMLGDSFVTKMQWGSFLIRSVAVLVADPYSPPTPGNISIFEKLQF